MFRSIVKNRKDKSNNPNSIKFNDEEYVTELKSFVKTAFAELPETNMNEETEEKKD